MYFPVNEKKKEKNDCGTERNLKPRTSEKLIKNFKTSTFL